MSSGNSGLFWAAAGATSMAVAAGSYYLWKKQRSKHEKPNVPPTPTDVHSLVRERFTSCVQHMKGQFSSMPQKMQLEFYSLYKQATMGNASDFVANPPPAYDIVAKTKYQAWKQHEGMERSAAMQLYIDKAVHYEFTKAAMVDDDDDDNFNPEDAVMDMSGMGNKPSTLANSEEDAFVDVAAELGAHPLHEAARDGNLATLQQLLESGQHKPDDLDPAGQTALHLAADRGNTECLQLLIKHGADVQAADHDGISVLQAAVIAGHVETCRLLCVLGANPDQPDRDGDTPRDCAKDDAILRDLLFRASMGQLVLDEELQRELQELGRQAAAGMSEPEEEEEDDAPLPSSFKQEDLKVFDDIPMELDDDGDM